MIKMEELLRHMVEKGASDLHLCIGIPPVLRINGELVHTCFDVIAPEMSKHLIYSLLTKEQTDIFEGEKELNFSFSIKGVSRFRINVYRQRGAAGLSARAVSFQIPSLEELGAPVILKEFADRPSGLFLITGPMGSGKSTTLAAMLEYINNARKARIVTIEDPIEYLFRHNKSVIDQREVGPDTVSFNNALRQVFRQDPDIVLIGDSRDIDSMQIALTLAETGNLVLAAFNTANASQSISRIIDMFPPYQQQQARLQLAASLIAVVSQQLIRRASDKPGGRILATEVINVTASIRNFIRENELAQIYPAIQTGKKYGMHTMNQCLADLYRRGEISYESALEFSSNQEELMSLVASI